MIFVDKIAQELENVFHLISSIAVRGDAVDTMAAARNKLRKAYAEIVSQIEAQKNEGEHDA